MAGTALVVPSLGLKVGIKYNPNLSLFTTELIAIAMCDHMDTQKQNKGFSDLQRLFKLHSGPSDRTIQDKTGQK